MTDVIHPSKLLLVQRQGLELAPIRQPDQRKSCCTNCRHWHSQIIRNGRYKRGDQRQKSQKLVKGKPVQKTSQLVMAAEPQNGNRYNNTHSDCY